MRTKLLSVVLVGLALPALAADPVTVKPGSYKLDPAHGKITWSVDHLGLSTYVGQFAKVSGTLKLDPKTPANSAVTAVVSIAGVGTLNPLLDEHLKSPTFFNAAKYPTASFVSTAVTATGPKTATVTGNLTLLGVTKPETLDVTFIGAGTDPVDSTYTVGFAATTELKRSDFGMKAYVPAVGDDVALSIEGEFKLQ